MSVPPIPPPLDQLGQRPFSFYPPILNVEHNEWLFRRATWSEILVLNTKSNDEIWVPRRFLGELSRIDEPVMIIGLMKELEYKAGAVWPHERRVIEMPRAVNEGPRPLLPDGGERPAPVVGIRLESGTESRIGRLIAATLVASVGTCVLVISFYRGATSGENVVYKGVLQTSLGLTAQDDYHAVVRKLGAPAGDRWRSEAGEVQYRVVDYPDRSLSVILMGRERDKALYIGAFDKNWKVIDSVEIPGGRNTTSMLTQLRRF